MEGQDASVLASLKAADQAAGQIVDTIGDTAMVSGSVPGLAVSATLTAGKLGDSAANATRGAIQEKMGLDVTKSSNRPGAVKKATDAVLYANPLTAPAYAAANIGAPIAKQVYTQKKEERKAKKSKAGGCSPAEHAIGLIVKIVLLMMIIFIIVKVTSGFAMGGYGMFEIKKLNRQCKQQTR